ncbi:MAG: HNH endonuclease [Chloroflexota bacterium]|nr:HNH endonuclease [Chloroflexota bacterium]
MNINLHRIPVRELVDGYVDNDDKGVVGFGGNLDIRPAFQREFIYDDRKRNAVIDSVIQGFPLNLMYWTVKGNGKYEVLDGQQRTISIAEYVNDIFAVKFNSRLHTFGSLPPKVQDDILNYKLMVYFCSGSDVEQISWYRTINIAGEVLYEQEILNAVYAGPWVSSARQYFSKRGCTAFKVGGDYLRGSSIRQDYLETVIWWISNGDIETYMATHRHCKNADSLKAYFRSVVDWLESIFTNRSSSRKKLMKGVEWGLLYNEHKHRTFDPIAIDAEMEELLDDDDVMESGICPFVITRDRKYIYKRTFDDKVKRRVFKNQGGICKFCKREFKLHEMEADHIKPWSEGGKSNEENCQMLCVNCNRTKGDK